MIAGKAWGSTELLLSTPFIEVHRLRILPHMQCSMHGHDYKWNAFYVISGELTIAVEKKSYPLVDETALRAGDFTTVKPGEFHRFISHNNPVEALEIYYPECLSEDIVRRDVGGMVGAQ